MLNPSKTPTWRLLLLALFIGDALAVIVFAAMGRLAAAVLAAGALGLAAVALALLAMLRSLVAGERIEEIPLSAERRRELLEEKVYLLARIRELEFDRSMGKISEADHREQVVAARDRALEVMRELEGAAGVRSLIERELLERLAARKITIKRAPAPRAAAVTSAAASPAAESRSCPACHGMVAAEAKFCHECGAPLTKETVR